MRKLYVTNLEFGKFPLSVKSKLTSSTKAMPSRGQTLDLLVEDEVVVELKAVSKLRTVATAQVLSYLKATGLRRGLLINFSESKLVDGVKRISL